MKTRLLIIAALLFTAFGAWSQTDGDTLLFRLKYQRGTKYVFKTVAGTTHTGYVIKETEDLVTIENRNIGEKMEINKNDIVSATLVKEKKPYQPTEPVYGENAHASSYMFAGSAFEFSEGSIVSHNHWLLLQNIDYALTKNWAFTTNAIAFYPLSLGVKCAYRISEDNFLSGNVFGMGNLFSSPGSNPFWGYGGLARFTHGSTNNNFTFSAGVLGLNAKLFDPSSSLSFFNLPFINAGYCNRFGPRVAFVAEAWYVPQTEFLLGGIGLKLVGNPVYSWTFGCYSFVNTYDNTLKINFRSIPIPYIGIGRKFN